MLLTRSAGIRVALCALVALVAPEVLRAQNPTESIACGSSTDARMECNTTGGSASRVEVARDLSGGRCRRNSTWGFTTTGIWTSGGCRADFSVFYSVSGGNVGAETRLMNCGRIDGTQVQCPTGGSASEVRLVRNLGGAGCTEGQNWGHTDTYIWANRGCRGHFEISYLGDDEGGGPKTRTITCGTSGTSRVACNPGGIVSSVRMLREFSSGRCRTNSTWGHDTREIWTTRGCRAEFEVTYQTVAEPF